MKWHIQENERDDVNTNSPRHNDARWKTHHRSSFKKKKKVTRLSQQPSLEMGPWKRKRGWMVTFAMCSICVSFFIVENGPTAVHVARACVPQSVCPHGWRGSTSRSDLSGLLWWDVTLHDRCQRRRAYVSATLSVIWVAWQVSIHQPMRLAQRAWYVEFSLCFWVVAVDVSTKESYEKKQVWAWQKMPLISRSFPIASLMFCTEDRSSPRFTWNWTHRETDSSFGGWCDNTRLIITLKNDCVCHVIHTFSNM